jgi:hypothetical protein
MSLSFLISLIAQPLAPVPIRCPRSLGDLKGLRGVRSWCSPALAGPTWAETSWGVYAHDDAFSVVAKIKWRRTRRDEEALGIKKVASTSVESLEPILP